MRAGAARVHVPSLSRKAMQGERAQEPAFTLYQLLVSLLALVIAVSLGLAYHHSRHPKPFFAESERVQSK